ncbi:RNA polymerase sigma factor [Phytohabitans kaempferiae]|uniref:RNA polymerase sigma factor n=1 Tax=Phytohabitans kaempferiae TaxID=1620943 RepID=A0ABV6LUT6_9ACTN
MTDVDAVYRAHSRRVLATLIRLLGDFDLAEEAVQDAFVAAVEQWPQTGPPANPYTWLVSAGRFKAIDRLRRRARFDALLGELAARLAPAAAEPFEESPDLPDDRLRLIFTCCHPALPADAQVAMTLREVCGLTTEEIARAFLTGPPTVAQRIVRAKNKIKTNRIGYAVPPPAELPSRLDPVLSTVYLIFTEGYAPASGEAVVRADLTGEAIRLGHLLAELLPDPEVRGLLALMLLQDSRRDARTTPGGDLVLLPDQDRSRWHRDQITAAADLLARARASGQVGTYALQARIALVHAEAPTAEATDWPRIVDLYDLLTRADPSPVVALNRAVALAMRDGPAAGLAELDAVLAGGRLDGYHLAHSARADLLRRLGRVTEARAAYERALALVRQEPQRRFLKRRLADLP